MTKTTEKYCPPRPNPDSLILIANKELVDIFNYAASIRAETERLLSLLSDERAKNDILQEELREMRILANCQVLQSVANREKLQEIQDFFEGTK